MTNRVVHLFTTYSGLLECLLKRQLPLSYKMIVEPGHQGQLSESQMAELNSAKFLIVDPADMAEHKTLQDLPNLTWMMATWAETEGPLSEDQLRELESADILLAEPILLEKYNVIHSLPNLTWMMTTSAGIDRIAKNLHKDKPLPSYTLTRFGGVFGQHMMEFVLGEIIAYERDFRGMRKEQEASKWNRTPFESYRILPQLQIGVLGAGDIGKSIAKGCKNFGMTVWGMTNRPVQPESKSPYIDHNRLFSDLPELLAECDYLCCVLPSTPVTTGMLSGDTLSQCKKKPVLINVGRGDLISSDSLINALDKGWIGHAILDVVDKEPLPADSPLWQHPGVTITPHVSACSFNWQLAEKFEENYKKFEANEKMNYVVDWEYGY